ncbi:DNA repair and genetic recombination [Listeria weihenstephanensis FSL R9-0317]|uniref:DNA repair protein RecN n=1 Tax=Listeria weihenstephanensis TaxID=1006155 RepID=A0A1S7FUL5_9LIST|nr:DNA repair protein RecN [Listeria weihenstephanensis]AQY51082.1 DNA recombination protein RecN [Listeria weihenstephanensis]EUJ36502.1 DNA repair and genetic recombination [Listeria weihenstephanensis FSL R9-0317]MBC1500071.1 DNA repair protein RecN [Listeria weihenstephanensis]
MLQELTIRNFAIIESLNLSFQEGMTVLTGETGAGKSIIIDALGLLVGGRGSVDFIRHGEEKLEIQGLFTINPQNKGCLEALENNGIDASDGMVVLERILFQSGKNACRINGKLATTVVLREIGSRLIDIHSQHEHQELMNDEFHLQLLDRFAWKDIESTLAKYQAKYAEYMEMKTKWRNWTKNEQELAQRLDMLRFQQDEITSSNLRLGEEETLVEQKHVLSNFEKINESLQSAYTALQGEERGLEFISEAMRHVESASDILPEYKALSESVASSFYLLEDSAMQIRQELDKLEFQPDELDTIETRLNELSQLKRKYGKTVEAIIQYNEEIDQEILELSDRETHLGHLEKDLEVAKEQLSELAGKITAIRQKSAKLLEKQIKNELNQLYMEKAIFQVNFATEAKEFTENGVDKVAFYMSTNPGEPLKPLSKVASGGELSRMMLALKTIFSRHQGITSIIFDEVDTGVSGRVAQAIAEKIYAVAIGSQVLCISHLPQVAAMADHHFYISKATTANRTMTSVVALSGEQKIEEISRMIAGIEVTDVTKQHASEMLTQANKIKAQK